QTRRLPVLGRSGQALEVVDELTINPDQVRIWTFEGPDPFEQAGVWRAADGQPLREDAFRTVDGRPVSLDADFMAPFMRAVADTVRSVREDWLLFAELDPFEAGMGHGFPPGMPARTVNANHWYDARTLVTKTFDPEFDAERLRGRYLRELSRIRAHGEALDAPTLIGEFGIPYDLNGGEAYERWADGKRDVWDAHERALSLMYDAIDELGLSSTQWNYTASNRNDLRIGDGWNQEDLSIYSQDQEGGRAVRGFARPYVRAAQGRLLAQRFDWRSGDFTAEIDVDPAVAAATEVFAAPAWFPAGAELRCDDSAVEVSWAGDLVQITAHRPGPLRLGLVQRRQ
ncbi:MAG TPA: endoglucanase, partial [Phenylobacterium sp.]